MFAAGKLFLRAVEGLDAKELSDPSIKQFLSFVESKLVVSLPSERASAAETLGNRYFRNNTLVKCCDFLDSLTMKSEADKVAGFKALKQQIRKLKPRCVARHVVRKLLSRMVLSEAAAADAIVLMLTPAVDDAPAATRGFLPKAMFKVHVVPVLMELYGVMEVPVRMLLLRTLSKHKDVFTKAELRTNLLPRIREGLQDTDDELVEETLRALADIAPNVGGSVIGGIRVNRFAKPRGPRQMGAVQTLPTDLSTDTAFDSNEEMMNTVEQMSDYRIDPTESQGDEDGESSPFNSSSQRQIVDTVLRAGSDTEGADDYEELTPSATRTKHNISSATGAIAEGSTVSVLASGPEAEADTGPIKEASDDSDYGDVGNDDFNRSEGEGHAAVGDGWGDDGGWGDADAGWDSDNETGQVTSPMEDIELSGIRNGVEMSIVTPSSGSEAPLTSSTSPPPASKKMPSAAQAPKGDDFDFFAGSSVPQSVAESEISDVLPRMDDPEGKAEARPAEGDTRVTAAAEKTEKAAVRAAHAQKAEKARLERTAIKNAASASRVKVGDATSVDILADSEQTSLAAAISQNDAHGVTGADHATPSAVAPTKKKGGLSLKGAAKKVKQKEASSKPKGGRSPDTAKTKSALEATKEPEADSYDFFADMASPADAALTKAAAVGEDPGNVPKHSVDPSPTQVQLERTPSPAAKSAFSLSAVQAFSAEESDDGSEKGGWGSDGGIGDGW